MENPLSINDVRPKVESMIQVMFDERIRQAEQIHPTYAKFWKTIEPMAMAGSKKRMRPYLTVIGYGNIDEEILKVATAQELIHLAMLIHDDVIDKDLVRNGQKNVIGQYIDEYTGIVDDLEVLHYANSAAILAGDAIISEAYLLLNDANFDQTIKKRVIKQMGTSIYEVIAGELMDVEATFRSAKTFDPISIYRYKTASYSLVGPLLSGAYCAEADEGLLAKLESFGIMAGIVFQVQDDLLGVYGDESKTGKSTVGDLIEGKRTLLVINHEQSMTEQQAARFDKYFGNQEATNEQLEQLKIDMIDSGAKDKTIDYIAECDSKISELLGQIDDLSMRQNLDNLIATLRNRTV